MPATVLREIWRSWSPGSPGRWCLNLNCRRVSTWTAGSVNGTRDGVAVHTRYPGPGRCAANSEGMQTSTLVSPRSSVKKNHALHPHSLPKQHFQKQGQRLLLTKLNTDIFFQRPDFWNLTTISIFSFFFFQESCQAILSRHFHPPYHPS